MNSFDEGGGGKSFPNLNPINNMKYIAPKRRGRGTGSIPLLESEILEVQKVARSANEAARMLGVCYNTYKKYATMYGVFNNLINQRGSGIPKGFSVAGQPKPITELDDILEGKHPEYPTWMLKKRLIENGYMLEKCNNCGFEERRVVDFKVPIMLDFLDGDNTNYKYDNLRFLCYNCSFLLNGNLFGRKKTY